MKKTFYIAALLISTSIVSSCTKENEATPTSVTKVADEERAGDHLGTGDGGVDRPPVKKPQ